MTTFRCKTKKQALTGSRETLHSKHLDMIKNFKNVKKTLTQKRKHLKDLQADLTAFDRQESKTPEDIAKILEMKEDIAICEREILKIDMNEEEDQYYMTNGDLIFQYFQNIDEIANDYGKTEEDDEDDEKEEGKDLEPSKGAKKKKESVVKGPKVTDFWMNSQKAKSTELPSIPENDEQAEPLDEVKEKAADNKRSAAMNEGGLNGWVERKENFKRAKMQDKYMSNIDPTHVITIDRVKEKRCPDCDEEMTLNQNEGYTECRICGYSEEVKVDSDKRSYKEATNTDMSYIAYKRINHFEVSRECKSGLKVYHLLVAIKA